LGARVDETADQPGAGNAVDLGMLARDPAGVDSASLLAGRKKTILPTRDSAFQVGGFDPAFAQVADHPLANFVTVTAVGNDRTIDRQFRDPPINRLWRTMDRPDDHFVIGTEGIRLANVDHQRRMGRPEAQIKVCRGYREDRSTHTHSP